MTIGAVLLTSHTSHHKSNWSNLNFDDFQHFSYHCISCTVLHTVSILYPNCSVVSIL